MSKIKIQGSASGTGVLTIAAPNTNTDRTVTIPDATGTLLDSGSDLPAANLTGTIADARLAAMTASKLTGTLPIARIADDAVTAAKLANSINTDIATGPAALPKAGGTMTGNTINNDNVKSLYGTGSDLEIYHTGSHGFIKNSGDGVLHIQGNNSSDLKVSPRDDEDSIIAKNNGAVELYHNNVKKIETTATGVTITGVVAATTLTGDGSALTGIDATTVSATVPSSPSQGDLWFNSSASTVSTVTTKTLAVYDNTSWKILQNAFSATGGTKTTSSGYNVHAFTSSGTFTPNMNGTVIILVVGGGAAGGIDHGGGGGGGGIAYHSGKNVTANTAYTVTVGAGGVGGYGGHTSGSQSGATSRQYPASAGGSNSSFHGVTGYGGGGASGCCTNQDGASGGSGGGAGTSTGGSGGAATQGTGGTTHYGNAGGGDGSAATYGGGGGGAGAAGGPQNNAYGGNGTRPVTWADAYGTNSSNSSTGGYFGGGGAGGGHYANPITNSIPQGIGGGGGWKTTLGNYSTDIYVGADGVANTGGGGSGIANPSSGSQYTAGSGGSGIVLIAYT